AGLTCLSVISMIAGWSTSWGVVHTLGAGRNADPLAPGDVAASARRATRPRGYRARGDRAIGRRGAPARRRCRSGAPPGHRGDDADCRTAGYLVARERCLTGGACRA